jgi:hypothetical protein
MPATTPAEKIKSNSFISVAFEENFFCRALTVRRVPGDFFILLKRKQNAHQKTHSESEYFSSRYFGILARTRPKM